MTIRSLLNELCGDVGDVTDFLVFQTALISHIESNSTIKY